MYLEAFDIFMCHSTLCALRNIIRPGAKRKYRHCEAQHPGWGAHLGPPEQLSFLQLRFLNSAMRTPWRKEQTKDLQQVLKAVDQDIPLVLVSGNHDIGNVPTAQTIEDFCQTWGDDYFSFWVGGVLFMVLNSQFFYDASKCPALKQAQDQWLDQQLSIAGQQRCQHVIVFQHIPLFLKSIDEDDDYFNLTKAVRKELADKFTRAVPTVLTGHPWRKCGNWPPRAHRALHVGYSSSNRLWNQVSC
ncbi:Cpped1 [Phodopus roborovskii]|uniref:Cpped1 protein n=1 Tax=Phodopus roborovskii TaxID=109678 RepID=A0AAU9Z499_PHORO|nr:Cpped1 [Phodopus roborovskii]